MVVPQLLVLDDQQPEIVPAIERLQHAAQASPGTQMFLRGAAEVLELLIRGLGPVELQSIGFARRVEFDGLLQLAELCDQSEHSNGIILSVLRHICCVGEILCHLEKENLINLHNANLYIIALGNSSLAASALAAAQNISRLREICLETIRIAFRLALELRRRASHIEQGHGDWSFTLSCMYEEELTHIIRESVKQETPAMKHIYIAEHSLDWLTICGPPSSLRKLHSHFTHPVDSPDWSIPMHSAQNASHLPRIDIASIVGTSSILQAPASPLVHISSSSEASFRSSPSLGAFLLQSCDAICHQPVRIDAMVASIDDNFLDGQKLHVITLGPTHRSAAIKRDLNERGIEIEDLETSETSLGGGLTLHADSEAIAIVSMAGRFPGNEDILQFWNSLLSGKQHHKRVPMDRFDHVTFNHVAGKKASPTEMPYGCFLEQPGLFDHHLFNISPREALQMDPNQRLLLTVSYEALQRAGYSSEDTLSTCSSRIATFIGQTTDDWRDVAASQGIDIYYIPGLLRIFGPGRLHYHFKWEGPSYSVDSACASSASAISLACKALIARECDTALAGGVNSLASPAMFAGLKKGGFLSPTGPCKPFQQDADGYCRAEGVGILVLKRLEDAVYDDDNILAVIRGQGRGHSAHATSITHPDPNALERLFRRTLRRAGVDPASIGYIEMHGTGTQAGDFAEVTAVGKAFGERKIGENPLIIGAVKANVGHAEAAAGVISIIKSIMILKTGIIPSQPGMPFTVNPRLSEVLESKIIVADGKACLQKPTGTGQRRRVMVNNFDAAGGNACFILEEAPPKLGKPVDPRSHHVVAISARTQFSLQRNQENLLNFFVNNPNINLADISYTTTARAMHESLRVAYVADSQLDLTRQLRQDLQTRDDKATVPSPRQTTFVFTGMSSQYAGMGAELFRTCTRFRKALISLQDICVQQGFPPFIDSISDPMFTFESSRTIVVQLAIVAIELALADLWKSWGIEPAFVIGHSLGEYAALCVAGVLSTTDTLNLVGMRASLMEEKLSPGTYTMLAVSQSSVDTARHLNALGLKACNVSCVNAPLSTVVAGPVNDLKILQQSLSTQGVRTVELNVQHGFHSAQFEVILADFIKGASGVRFSKPKIPVASSLLGTVVRKQDVFGAEYLARQSRQPVQFINAVESCMKQGIADPQTVWLEIGPDPVCINFVRAILGSCTVLPSLKRSEPNWKTIAMSASTFYKIHASIQWTEYHRDYVLHLSLLELPTYAFDETNHWRPYKTHESPTVNNSETTLVSSSRVKLSHSLHYVLHEVFNEEDTRVTFTSQLQDPELNAAVRGHKLEDTSLCPSSVFCDMAFTAASYILARCDKYNALAIELENLRMEHPIVISESSAENTIETAAKLSTVNGRGKIDLTFHHRVRNSSYKSGGGEIRVGELGQWQNEFAQLAFFVNARATTVMKQPTHHFQKPVVYKLFSSVVCYSQLYQAIDELFWDEPANEAVAMITLPNYEGARATKYSPYWLDSMIHLAGFILNANLCSMEDVVYVCNGLATLRILQNLSAGKTYRSYVRRHQDESNGTSLSDVFLFDGERLIAVCLHLRFQKLPRLLFRRLLQNAKREAQAGSPSSNATTTNISSQRCPATFADAEPTGLGNHRTMGAQSKASREARECSDEEKTGLLLRLLSEETGVDLAALVPSTEFDSIGVDSILGIAIIDRFNELTNLRLGVSFLAEAKNVAEMQAMFRKWNPAAGDPSEQEEKLAVTSSDSDTTPTSSVDSDLDGKITDPTQRATGVDVAAVPAPVIQVYPQPVRTRQSLSSLPATGHPISKAILLHGDHHKHRVALFLVPGGAGAAARFYHLPPFPSKLPVYALDSPYLHCPQRYCSTVEEVAALYVAAIRKLQPRGPYMIAGYSAGGHHAYEIASQLIQAGESIFRLIILDMHIPLPMPRGQEVTPSLVKNVVLAMGLVESTSYSTAEFDQDTAHRAKVLEATLSYSPRPLPSDCRPEKSIVIWAGQAVSDGLNASQLQRAAAFGLEAETDGNVMQDPVNRLGWFFSRRRNFGPNGWDALLGPVECYTIDGANHVTLMSPPALWQVSEVGRLLEQAVAVQPTLDRS